MVEIKEYKEHFDVLIDDDVAFTCHAMSAEMLKELLESLEIDVKHSVGNPSDDYFLSNDDES